MKKGITKRATTKNDRVKAARQAAFASARNLQGMQISRPVGNNPANRGLRQAGTEVKGVDVPITTVVLSTTGTFTLLNGIQEGSSFYNRIGRKVNMKSLHFTGHIDQTGNGGGVDDYIRIMIIYDQQPNGNFPATADILLNYNNAGATETNSHSHLNLNNRDRFSIVADIRLETSHDTGAASDGLLGMYTLQETNVNRFIKLKNLVTQYKSTTNPAAIGDITTGALYLFTLGQNAVATAAYQLLFTSRLRYLDN